MAAYDCSHFQSCFDDWIAQQHEDLHELVTEDSSDNEKLKLVSDKCIKHFEDYCEKRAQMVESNASCFISPAWCSAFENSYLWLGGYKPSLYITHIYSVWWSDVDANLAQFFPIDGKDDLGQLSPQQLRMIENFHSKTLREEDILSSKMTILQEDIGKLSMKSLQVVGELNENVERVINAHNMLLAGLIRDADRLRVTILKDLMGILTPCQGVEFLVSTKKLHLSIHEWGKKKKCGSCSTSESSE